MSSNSLMIMEQKALPANQLTHSLKIYGEGSMQKGILNLIKDRDNSYALGIHHNQIFNETVKYPEMTQKGIIKGAIGGSLATLLATIVIPSIYEYATNIKPKYLSLIDDINEDVIDAKQCIVDINEEVNYE